MKKEEKRDVIIAELKSLLQVTIKAAQSRSHKGDNRIYSWNQVVTRLNDYIRVLEREASA